MAFPDNYPQTESMQQENPVGVVTAIVMTAAFFFATALTNVGLWLINICKGRNTRISPNSIQRSGKYKQQRRARGNRSNVVDLELYRLFRSRRS